MTIGNVASVTHPGRKRRHNEDSFVCKPPLFAIADGMGGAQAGELASRLAATALAEDEGGDGATAEERISQLIQEANRRVYERASADDQASGMGTTVTLALVEDERVVIGHVGDSRAYLLRDGTLDQLTDDHSLVAELVRGGKLSPEEAEHHPQRSVITRAVGPDPDVDVDVFSVEARPADVFLLCSDGLTDMVPDDEIESIVRRHRDDLEDAARALIKAANRGGGEDNITVVCFEVAEAEETSEQAAPPAEPTVLDEPSVEYEEEEDTLDELTTLSPVIQAPPRRRGGRSRAFIITAVVVVALVLAAVAGVWAISRAHFVGARSDGHVVVYQGVPWDVVGGLHLYRAVYVSPLLTAELSQPERRQLFDHDLQSEDAAVAAVRRYEQRIGQ